MKTTVRQHVAIGVTAGLALGATASDRETAEEDIPIVVEESGPIALGDPDTTPFGEEVQVIDDDEPQVVTRTVYVRERPAPTPSPAPTNDPDPAPQPVTPPRATAIPAGTSVPMEILAQIDSEHHNVGDAWTGRVTRDIVVNGRVVIPAGVEHNVINAGEDEFEFIEVEFK